eukprot:UN03102
MRETLERQCTGKIFNIRRCKVRSAIQTKLSKTYKITEVTDKRLVKLGWEDVYKPTRKKENNMQVSSAELEHKAEVKSPKPIFKTSHSVEKNV